MNSFCRNQDHGGAEILGCCMAQWIALLLPLGQIASQMTFAADTDLRLTAGRAAPVVLTENARDDSAGGLACFKIQTPTAIYFLEKSGAGLSSMLDQDSRDWLSFHPRPGSGAGGEFRGFPNAVHQQAGKMNRQMTVFGFGRQGLNKFLDTVPQQFSIGFLETTNYAAIGEEIRKRFQAAPADPGNPKSIKP